MHLKDVNLIIHLLNMMLRTTFHQLDLSIIPALLWTETLGFLALDVNAGSHLLLGLPSQFQWHLS